MKLKESVEVLNLRYQKQPMDRMYYSLFGGLLSRYRVKKILHELGDTKDKFILDVGCEAGYISLHMAEQGKHIVSIDPCKPALLRLKEKVGESDNPEIKGPLLGIAHYLPLKSGFVGHIVCSEVIQFTPNIDSILEEFARVLEDGGQVILTFPNERFRRFLYPFSRLFGIDTGFQTESVPFFYSMDEIEKLAKKPFRILRKYKLPFFLFPLTNVVVFQKEK
jgi:ubiquinone/menaquinone biosynthesis C-methylase UbiE